MTAHEAAARTAKAMRLVAVFEAHGADAVTVAALPATGWATVATLAGTRPPSDATKATVVGILRGHEAIPARAAR
ncbi:MAG: hypothetical protein ABR511_11165 [Acidimicrobiales bacterium]